MEGRGESIYIEAFNRSQRLLSRCFALELDASTLVSVTPLIQGFPKEEDKVTQDSLPSIFVRMVEWLPLLERSDASYGICHGMMTLANSYPTHIDAFLIIYLEAIALSSSHLINSKEQTLAFQLLMNMSETANTGYRTNDCCKNPGVFRPGTDDPVNASNIIFKKSDVQEHLDQVLKVTLQQAKEGNDYIVRAAMYARFAILVQEKKPQWYSRVGIHDYGIQVQLKKIDSKAWIKHDLIAALIRLRGYAKSLSKKFAISEETQGTMDEWQSLLMRWIYDPELDKTRDLMVKYHVILALKNLQEGPFDETSNELFRARDWVM
ncbi:hypothetical protein GLAREA_05196 [Glarea lozoyensis ATCC 20868]|uniref:Uncharacterized protein n=1 Tax=Glarea lozoyensis (strain ATCC 20868 / MF5171) TaxID=1116229 RepID=S3EC35_GLAL2|nr:uncharacterized protein GLAREA_05196 [Glarea lozoyensis ATCC 20868]EPE35858.1 hypothetical protein GLAREA_05196 [Glarea lozoyensis ATCC 20868]